MGTRSRRIGALRGAVPALLLVSGGCGEDTRLPSHPDALLLIVIDTLRADRVGYAGYPHARTPTLDSLATVGVRFDDASTPVPVTLPAVTSLMTGSYPPRHGVRDNGSFALDPGVTTLAECFRAAGFRTGAVMGSAVLAPDRGLDRGFEIYDADFRAPYPVYDEALRPYANEFATNRRRADRVTDRAAELVRAFGPDPFFLFVHYFDPHMAYDPPPRFAAMHPDRPYDGEVSFVDEQIGRLLGALTDRDEVLVVVVADHGESQGEHGEPQHGFLLYQATLQVPLVVTGPGVPRGVLRSDPVALVDLAPTLATVFGLEDSSAFPDGRTLDWSRPVEAPRDLYAETMRPRLSYGWSELRSLRRGTRKLIRGAGRTELYDLARDPAETADRSAEEDYDDLSRALDDWVFADEPSQIEAALQDPARAQSRELLESLGYLAADDDVDAESRPHPSDALPLWIAKQEAKEQLRRAALLLSQGQLEAADSLAIAARPHAPSPADVAAFRGYIAEQRGDVEAARGQYEEALNLDPDEWRAHRGLARLSASRGDSVEALRHWRLVASGDTSDVDALRAVALALLNGPDAAAALRPLRRLVRIDSTDATARYNLALAALAAGRGDEARIHFEATLRLDPADPEAPAIRHWLAHGRWPE